MCLTVYSSESGQKIDGMNEVKRAKVLSFSAGTSKSGALDEE